MGEEQLSTVSPIKKTDLDNHDGWEWFCGIPAKTFQPYIGKNTHTRTKHNTKQKTKINPRVDTLKRVRRILSLHPCHPSFKAAQLSANRDFLRMENECVSEHLCGTVPHPDYRAVLCHCVMGSEGEKKLRLRGHQRGMDSTNCFVGSIRKPTHKLLGQLKCRSPQLLCMPHPHTPPSRVCTTDGADPELCRVPVQLRGIGRKHIELAISHHPRESKWEAVSTQPGFVWLRKVIKS